LGHPSQTARQGNLYNETVTKGINRDLGPLKEASFVYCKQCGFICNTSRDAKGINEFAGETITSGNLLANGSFENWTGSNLDSWTVTGSVTKTSTSGYFDKTDDGSYSIKITRAGTTISLTQNDTDVASYSTYTVTFRAKVKCTTKDMIRLAMTINSVTYYSNYNRGQQMWEDISVVHKSTSLITEVDVYILADNANGTAYVDCSTLMSDGLQTALGATSGCPHCSSYFYT